MSADVVAIIPARGGSKRIPGKNIKNFDGRPMISWPIVACLGSESISRVVVSTDSDDIARVARAHGAEVPFARPDELASDIAGTAPVIRHAIETLSIDSNQWVLCVYPTAAIDTSFLDEAINQALSAHRLNRFTISVGRHRSPLERALEENSDSLFQLLNPDALLSRTQDLPQRYFDAGKFYLATAQTWSAHETMMAEPFEPFFLPDWATVDIDEPEDWAVAEALHRSFSLRAT
ncbi:pseudaminic acid cytidylyltransferase [Pontimonas sp.]|nr:pseudaminic acid cytidylyltransferase [Pontimonas sp.]